MSHNERIDEEEQTKHIQRKERKKKEYFVTDTMNIIVFQTKETYKINYEGLCI
jgi:hypothetical protein